MKNRKRLLAMTAALAFTLPLEAQAAPAREEVDWEQVCSQVTAQPFTPPVESHHTSEAPLQKCDATALYYGFDRAPDYGAALECAYSQRAHPDPSLGDPFRGPGVLMMLYANGKGVQRNYDLAIRFACENPWIRDGGMASRIGRLEQLRQTGAAVTNFDLCDDGTSGLMMGACSSVKQQFADAKRQKELDAVAQHWSPQIKQAFQALQAAEKKFEDTRAANEVDMSGSGRAAFYVSELGRLRDQFLINLKRFGNSDVPSASLEQQRAKDRELNAVYQQIQDIPARDWDWGTVKQSGIGDTERAWIKLRDAWVEFGRIAYPRLSAATISTQITRLRVHQLRSLLPKE